MDGFIAYLLSLRPPAASAICSNPAKLHHDPRHRFLAGSRVHPQAVSGAGWGRKVLCARSKRCVALRCGRRFLIDSLYYSTPQFVPPMQTGTLKSNYSTQEPESPPVPWMDALSDGTPLHLDEGWRTVVYMDWLRLRRNEGYTGTIDGMHGARFGLMYAVPHLRWLFASLAHPYCRVHQQARVGAALLGFDAPGTLATSSSSLGRGEPGVQ